MKYEVNKTITITILIISIIIITAGIIIEGTNIVTRNTIIECPSNSVLNCPNPTCKKYEPCETPFIQPGTTIKLQATSNQTNINIINSSVWITIITGLLINHYKYNKKYPIKKEIKKIIKKISSDLN